MKTWVSLNGGRSFAIQLDGLITRAATTSGHMFAITNATDFEFYSSNSAGGIQGLGYQARNAGCAHRILRPLSAVAEGHVSDRASSASSRRRASRCTT